MRRLAVLSVALVACLLVAPWSALAADTSWVRGAVTAVGADSITVSVEGKDWVFKIDKETDVIVRGGATATKAAIAKGEAGAALTSLIKVGDGVEVHYKDAAGAKLATMIRGGITVPKEGAEKTEKAEGKSAKGDVTAVAADSLTITSGGAEMKFMIDAKTHVEGTGIGTAGRALQAAGKPVTVENLVGAKDEVIVYYDQMGTMMHATTVRVMKKAK